MLHFRCDYRCGSQLLGLPSHLLPCFDADDGDRLRQAQGLAGGHIAASGWRLFPGAEALRCEALCRVAVKVKEKNKRQEHHCACDGGRSPAGRPL